MTRFFGGFLGKKFSSQVPTAAWRLDETYSLAFDGQWPYWTGPTPVVSTPFMLVGCGGGASTGNGGGGGGGQLLETTIDLPLNDLWAVQVGKQGVMSERETFIESNNFAKTSFRASAMGGGSEGEDGACGGGGYGQPLSSRGDLNPPGPGGQALIPSGYPGGNGAEGRYANKSLCDTGSGGTPCKIEEPGAGGGGGGLGGPGMDGTNIYTPGAGGDGIANSFTGTEKYYCGGGAGSRLDIPAMNGIGANYIGGALYPNGAIYCRFDVPVIEPQIFTGDLVINKFMDGDTTVFEFASGSGTVAFTRI